MALPTTRGDREFQKFIERDDGQVSVAVDIESADQGGTGGGGGNDTYYAKPSGTNADATVAYTSATTITVTGLSWTFNKYDITKITQVPTSGNVTKFRDTADFAVSSGVITVTGATFAATDKFIVTLTGSPRTENTPTSSTQTTRLNPDSEEFTGETNSASSQGDGTTNYYYDMSGYDGLSIQIEDTPGTAGDNTYTIEATNQDDGTAASSCVYQDITQYGMSNVIGAAAASFTTDVFLHLNDKMNCKFIKVKVVRANDGANTDGAWDILTKRWYS